MSNIFLKPFQIDAIERLKREVLHRWERDTRQNIKFQSPTGSGKTVIMAQFVRDMFTAPELLNSDFCFVWASVGGSKEGDLAQQSRNKFYQYYGGVSVVDVTGLESLTANKTIKRNEILFFNWSMVNVRNKQGRRIRSDNERGISWDGMLRRTQHDGRRIILIIDEAHANSETPLAEEQINLIAPKIVIRITATHRQQDDIDVNIRHNDVINAGLIKKSIITQTRDDFRKKDAEGLDKRILQIALKKREELKKLYDERGLKINPLLLIQLPNDESAAMEGESRRDWVVGMLREEGVEDGKIAIWLDKEKTRLGNITMNNNDRDILLFKQAPSVGWDCPRAQIIIMYREIQNPVFQIQVLGRVLRMPEAMHYLDCEELNSSYLYTTYAKGSIMSAYDDWQGENITETNYANRKPGITPLKFRTYRTDRARYRDLDPAEFQFVFIRVANKMHSAALKNQIKTEYTRDEGVRVRVVVDAKIKDYDNFLQKIRVSPDMSERLSPMDVEKMYRKLCIDVLREQEGDEKFGNASRSYGVLKAALNVWFEKHLKMREKRKYYPVIVNDLMKESNSKLLLIINKAIEEYARIMGAEEEEQEKRELREEPIEIPRKNVSYTSRYKEEECKKCAMMPCFVDKVNENERDFINHLEGNEQVVWWYKNGDNGAENFSVKRDTGELFFPDWFVMTKSGKIWILDTKSGFTATGKEAESRAIALRKWLEKNKKHEGGLIKQKAGLWKIATDDTLKNWQNLEF